MAASQADRLREHFLGWQCRIRQIAMRKEGGRPSRGMQPRLLDSSGRELASAITVLIVPKEPEESTAFFRFQVQKTNDPRLIYESGLAFLQSDYFQRPSDFSDRLTALFPIDAPVVARLVEEKQGLLEFDQYSQAYRLACNVTELPEDDPAFEATIWHNRLFNPGIPAAVHVLAFQPDWAASWANPAPPTATP